MRSSILNNVRSTKHYKNPLYLIGIQLWSLQNSNIVITIIFCLWHDSIALYAKDCNHMMARIRIIWIFHQIWIVHKIMNRIFPALWSAEDVAGTVVVKIKSHYHIGSAWEWLKSLLKSTISSIPVYNMLQPWLTNQSMHWTWQIWYKNIIKQLFCSIY